MKILYSTPKKDGFRMPAEYENHYGCIMIWPERRDSWQYGGYSAKEAFCKVAKAISESEKLTILVSPQQYDTARRMLNDTDDRIRLVEMSTDDSWARDVAPTFVKNKDGEIRGIDWGFNAWGGLVDGLYFPWEKDNMAARKICDLFEKDVYNMRDFIFEGGSVHSDGEGTLMVTERCLLSEGRNPKMTKEEIEEKILSCLGAEKVLWLPYGIYMDETNEHVDNICAFVKPAEVVLAFTDDKSDPQYEMSLADYEYLSNQTDARGRKIKIHKLPLPSPVYMKENECKGLDYFHDEPTRTSGERLAASYVNFYISNNAIIMPAFNDKNDLIAKNILQDIFKDKKVIQIYARDILIGGGNIHCITQQIPSENK